MWTEPNKLGTRSISVNISRPDCCRGGVGFESSPFHSILKTSAAMSDTGSESMGMPWPINRRYSLQCKVRTSRQKSCNQSVGCVFLKLLSYNGR